MRTRPFAWWEATAHSFSAVIVGCLFAIVPLAVAFCVLESDIGWEPVGLATWIAIVAIVIALPVNLVYGLPAYATLRAWGRDNYMTCMLVGLVPGIPMFAAHWSAALACFYFGAAIGLTCHWLAKREARALANRPILPSIDDNVARNG